MQPQHLAPIPNQRPFLTHRRAQIFKLLHQQERALLPVYLLRPDQQVPQARRVIPLKRQPSARQKPAQKEQATLKQPPAEPFRLTKIFKPTTPSVPVLLEETKAALLRAARKPRGKFRF